MALADHIYVGQGLGFLGDEIDLLPTDMRQAMCDLFLSDYLSESGWVRAISLRDASMQNLNCAPDQCSDEAKVSMRPDWTAVGGYGGLLGAAVDSLADLDGGLEKAIRALETASVVADPWKGTMPAQGIAVQTTPMFLEYLNTTASETPQYAFAPAFPEFFDKTEQSSGFPSDWPNTARSIQNAEGSILDCFVRTIFGWRPSWGTWVGLEGMAAVEAAIEAAIWKKDEPRGDFNGTLSHVKTPHGDITLTAGKSGVSWVWT